MNQLSYFNGGNIMNRVKKILCSLCAVVLVMSLSATSFFVAGTNIKPDNPGTEISANVQGSNFLLSRAAYPKAYAVSRGSTDIKDDNHAFNKAVEVWCVSKTWLQSYYLGTADGIPDWTLMAMCQMSVSNGSPNYVTSPTASVYNRTSTTATTKKVNAKDGGNASATGYHTIKDYNGKIIWTSETKATERF